MGRQLLAAAILLATLVPAWSQTAEPGKRVEIEQIRQEMQALQAQLALLNERLEQALQPTESSVAPSPAIEVATSGTTPAEVHVPGVRPAEKALDSLRVGGYGSFRFESNDIAPGPKFGQNPPVQRSARGFDFRRFVMTVDATPSPRVRFYSEVEYERFNEIELERTALPENRGLRERAGVRFIQEVEGQDGSEIALEQAWAQFHLSSAKPSLAALRMGVVLPPVGRFNLHHDDDYWDLPRRPLVDRGGPVLPVKSAWRELGAGLVGTIPVGSAELDYQAYVLGGVKLDFAMEEVAVFRQGREVLEREPEIKFASGPFNGSDTADAFSWRLGLRPTLGTEVAVSGYHGKYTPGYINTRSSIHSLGIDGKTGWKGFEVEGEFVYTDFGRVHAVLADIARQAVDSVAETSSAEAANLESELAAGFSGPFTNQRYGYWVDFKYRFWPQWLNRTFLGAGFENPQLIPIFRAERIWFNDYLTDFTFAAGKITSMGTENKEQQRLTLGLTYRPIPNVAMTGAFEHNRRIQGSTMIFPQVQGLGGLPDKTFRSILLGMSVGF